MRGLMLILLLVPGSLMAQTVLSPDAFDRFSRGMTLYFTLGGAPYGAEQYLPGHRSIWQYSDGSCTKGEWFTRGEMVCFVYQDDPQEQCWRFLKSGNTYSARPDGQGDAQAADNDLRIVGSSKKPLKCKAPDVGV